MSSRSQVQRSRAMSEQGTQVRAAVSAEEEVKTCGKRCSSGQLPPFLLAAPNSPMGSPRLARLRRSQLQGTQPRTRRQSQSAPTRPPSSPPPWASRA